MKTTMEGIRKRSLTALLLLFAFLLFFCSSCSVEGDIPLCSVSLKMESSLSKSISVDYGFSMSDFVFFYQASSNSSKCYGATPAGSFVKVPETISLSQGKWNFSVIAVAKDKLSGETELPDSYGDYSISGSISNVYVNLNTTSIEIPVEYNLSGATSGMVQLIYKALIPNGYNLQTLDVDYEKMGSNTKTNVAAASVLDSTNREYTYTESPNLSTGLYVAKVNINSFSDFTSPLRFVETIAFSVTNGVVTKITGEVRDLPSFNITPTNNSDVFIPSTQKKTTEEEGTVYVVGGTSSDAGTSSADLTKTAIVNNSTYVVTTTDDSFSLSHADTGTADASDNRMVTPKNNTNFGFNMAGKDIVIESTYATTISKQENTTIVQLNDGVVMTLFNRADPAEDAIYGVFKGTTFANSNNLTSFRYESDIILNGGTLNVGTSLSNGKITLRGSSATDRNYGTDYLGLITTNVYKRSGAVGIEGAGGTVNVTNGTTIEGVLGISNAVNTSDTAYNTFNSEIDVSINLSDGSVINATGGSKNDDVGIGIYLNGTTTNKGKATGVIDIILSGEGTGINAQTCPNGKVCKGIFVENYQGELNITVTNGATISTSGYAIYLSNCTGEISICLENDSSLSGTTGSIYTSGCNGYYLTKNGSKTYVSQ